MSSITQVPPFDPRLVALRLRARSPPDAALHFGRCGDAAVGLRPTAGRLSPAGLPDAQPARDFLTDPLGSEVIVNVPFGERPLQIRMDRELSRPDQIIYLGTDPRGVHVFDAISRTGLALPARRPSSRPSDRRTR